MDKTDKRLMLAGHALTGLLTQQDKDKGWDIGPLAVVSLKIADAIMHFANEEQLPDLVDAREPEPTIVIEPKIITPRE